MLIFGAGNKVTNCRSLLGTVLVLEPKVQPPRKPLYPDEPGWLVPLAYESTNRRVNPVL